MRVGVVAIPGLAMLSVLRPQSRSSNSTITAVPGIKACQLTLNERPTGFTVVLTEAGATAGVDVHGALLVRARPVS
jgi:L-aminopeptidase/D-esterase-like protein